MGSPLGCLAEMMVVQEVAATEGRSLGEVVGEPRLKG